MGNWASAKQGMGQKASSPNSIFALRSAGIGPKRRICRGAFTYEFYHPSIILINLPPNSKTI